jgi:hypothetical protein
MKEHLIVLSAEQIVDLLMEKQVCQSNVSITSKSSMLSVLAILHEKMNSLTAPNPNS